MKPTEPALTPDEWSERRVHRIQHFGGRIDEPEVTVWFTARINEGERVEITRLVGPQGTRTPTHSSVALVPDEMQAVAALCLHTQTFGFSWEDVDALRSASRPTLGNLADRISALLPPRAA